PARSGLRSCRMGMHAGAVGEGHRHLPRGGAAARIVRLRRRRRPSARGARAAAARARERRAAGARRGARRRAARLGAGQGGVRRPGALVAAQRGLGRALGVAGAPSALMADLPRPARIYVVAVIAAGLALMVYRLPALTMTMNEPLLFLALLVLSSVSASLKVSLPLTTSGSTMSVSDAVDFASLLL